MVFLHNVIDKFGFGMGFKKWIRLLYTGISSKVLVNRYLTDGFSVQRSVRQGCSLSPALYVLCFEVLALRLRNDTIYKGIRLPDGVTEVRLIAHADDATLFTEKLEYVKRFFDVYSEYAKVSGASINKDKCVLMMQGRGTESESQNLGIKVEDRVKICGIWFGEGAQKINEEKILEGIRDGVKRYDKRNLNLYTRTTIINTVFLSKLWYIAAVCDFSKGFLKAVDSIGV
jgi:hypothetical protein